jgi:probable FeS assembly SUF system protein SufT
MQTPTQTREQIALARDITAIQIPDGNRVKLSEGTPVVITQALGGSYTVMTDYGQMLRIDEKDADAIGKERPADSAAAGGETLEERIWNQLRKVYDPEIPVNVVELGLVYDCQLEEREDGTHDVQVKMTLTAPGCGMGDVLAQDVQQKVENLDGVHSADVEIVFDPQWSMEMMSEAARLQLGML